MRDVYPDVVLPVLIPAMAASLVYLRLRGKSAGYLLCFSLFVTYLYGLAAHTIFPFPVYFHPRGFKYACLHLVPALIEGNDPSFVLQNEQVYGNFLTGVPFGVALPFVATPGKLTARRVLLLCLGLALAPEIVQLAENLLFDDFMIRTVDIDDVWLSFAGTLAGGATLRLVAAIYRRIGWVRAARLPVWDHFHAVLLSVAAGPVFPVVPAPPQAAPPGRPSPDSPPAAASPGHSLPRRRTLRQ